MIIIVAVGFFIWLIVLSWIVLTLRHHYFNLISRTRRQHIDEILDALLATDKKVEVDTKRLKEELREEINRSKFHLQKIGLVRFNPFERMGGEQSFVLALLDGQDNGLTVNFIYTRDGLRVYTKRVKSGKGEEYDLSPEEKKAIEKSQK